MGFPKGFGKLRVTARNAALRTLLLTDAGMPVQAALDMALGAAPHAPAGQAGSAAFGTALAARDRHLCAELAYGCLRAEIRIDYVLGRVLPRPGGLPRPLRHILALGVYGLLLQDRTPPHAVLHEAVEQARTLYGPRLAGLTNALKVVGKKKEDVRIVTSGAGAAAIAIVKLLLSAGFRNVTMCDRKGAIYKGREGLNWIKEEMAEVTNLERSAGSLADMLVGADVFIGVSAPGTVTTEMVKPMNKDAIVFACANPTPEIFPEDAKAGGAKVVSTGRSDYPNQINNVLAFPGIFRGAFDVRASDINEEMKVAAAHALAELISESELSEDYIIPKAFDHRVGPAVAKAVAEAARRTGVARI